MDFFWAGACVTQVTSAAMQSEGTDSKTCFVTVGTTNFDDLVTCFDDPEVHAALRAQGIAHLEVQIGRGERPAEGTNVNQTYGEVTWIRPESSTHLPTTWFRFAPSLDAYMRKADLIISHAGAGSIMEALALRKPLIVVINEKLMDNHQSELAEALQEREYLKSTTCSKLAEALCNFDVHALKAYPQQDLDAFPSTVDQEMGFGERKLD